MNVGRWLKVTLLVAVSVSVTMVGHAGAAPTRHAVPNLLTHAARQAVPHIDPRVPEEVADGIIQGVGDATDVDPDEVVITKGGDNDDDTTDVHVGWPPNEAWGDGITVKIPSSFFNRVLLGGRDRLVSYTAAVGAVAAVGGAAGGAVGAGTGGDAGNTNPPAQAGAPGAGGDLGDPGTWDNGWGDGYNTSPDCPYPPAGEC